VTVKHGSREQAIKMAGPVKTELPPSSMERADQSLNNCPNESSIGDASSQIDSNRLGKQKTD
jgi:hypothetical protein